ncbi:MAG TPA: hypothetical protein PLC15_13875, partial [Candidatus Obscuribacter sp.]|nr:hypothetical protein [Candidatus Obscuribacter sp.]
MQGAPTNLQLSLRLLVSIQLACFAVMPCQAEPTAAAPQPGSSAASPTAPQTTGTVSAPEVAKPTGNAAEQATSQPAEA